MFTGGSEPFGKGNSNGDQGSPMALWCCCEKAPALFNCSFKRAIHKAGERTIPLDFVPACPHSGLATHQGITQTVWKKSK